MGIGIQNTNLMKGERNLDNVVLSIRVRGAEAVRFWKIMDLAKSRNPYADRTVVLRELFGLSKPDILTTEDIEYFRQGKKSDLIAVPHKGLLSEEVIEKRKAS